MPINPYTTTEIDGKTVYECRYCDEMSYDPGATMTCCDHDHPRATLGEKTGDDAVPDSLKDETMEYWVVWNRYIKMPLAPWQTGNLIPARWGGDLDPDERPETTYSQARKVADFDSHELEGAYGQTPTVWNGWDGDYKPTDFKVPNSLDPTLLLPHEPRQPDPPLVFIDFDDVRTDVLGWIPREVQDLLDRLDAYTEVSSSGEGLHVLVRGELPDGRNQFLADLETAGHIEIYDSARMTGMTWRHVEGTPVEVPERQSVIEEIVEKYVDRERSGGAPSRNYGSRRDAGDLDIDPEDVNPYFRADYVDIRDVADTGEFAEYRTVAPGDKWQGPHPVHGSTSGEPRKSNNTNIDTDNNRWFCFKHRCGGTVIDLIANRHLDSVDCEKSMPKSIGRIIREHATPEFYQACIIARDVYADGDLDDVEPPYEALVGVAKDYDIGFEDEDEQRLGHKKATARTIYDSLTAADVLGDEDD